MPWSASPRYLCRRWATFQLLKEIPKGKFLEIGFATGNFLLHLAKRGYHGKGLEISEEAVKIAKENLRKFESKIKVEREDFYNINEIYDIIFAFEVLEHITDDKEALQKWNELLRKDGALIISVPAHKKMWGATDEYAGHLRRYEKGDLINILKETNFTVDRIWSYGFPLINILKPFRDIYYAKKIESYMDKHERTKNSGTTREIEYKFRFFMNDFFFFPVYLLQNLFFNFDFGEGYIIKARKI